MTSNIEKARKGLKQVRKDRYWFNQGFIEGNKSTEVNKESAKETFDKIKRSFNRQFDNIKNLHKK